MARDEGWWGKDNGSQEQILTEIDVAIRSHGVRDSRRAQPRSDEDGCSGTMYTTDKDRRGHGPTGGLRA